MILGVMCFRWIFLKFNIVYRENYFQGDYKFMKFRYYEKYFYSERDVGYNLFFYVIYI